jgi:hypothetical protein
MIGQAEASRLTQMIMVGGSTDSDILQRHFIAGIAAGAVK